MYCESMTFQIPSPPATTATTTTATTMGTASVEALVEALRSVLELRPAPDLTIIDTDPQRVADRLRSTSMRDARSYQEGYDLGTGWAEDSASLEELRDIAALRGSDWSSLRLPEGHSLLASLRMAGVLPEEGGSVDLPRDTLAEGVVDGAADALDRVLPHL